MSTTQSSSQPQMTVQQYMSLPENQKYNTVTFFEEEIGGLTHKELAVSKYGAIFRDGIGRKEFFGEGTIFNLDEVNQIVNLGTPTTYQQLKLKYKQIFYS